MIRDLFCDIWRKSRPDTIALIRARALKLYPHNNLRRERYVAMQVVLLEGMK